MGGRGKAWAFRRLNENELGVYCLELMSVCVCEFGMNKWGELEKRMLWQMWR